MSDFKTMIKGMKEQETPETPTQEETEKAGKLADSGFKIGEHRFIGKDNNKANPGFIAYGGNNPDQKLSTKELAKIYDEQQKAKNIDPEQDRLAKLKKDAIAESQATAKKEAPLVDKPKVDRFDELAKTWKDKPHKVFNGKEYYIRPYTDFAGNRFYDINTKKQGKDFDLGSASGYDFKTEDEAIKMIDEWENNARTGASEELDDFAEYIDNYLGYDGYTATKNPDGTYSTNLGQEDPDAEPVQLTPAEFESLYRKMVSEDPTMKGDFANYRRKLPKTNDANAPRLLKPTDDFTDAEIKNFLDYLFYTNIDQGYTYEKTPQGDYYTNLVAGDPEAEPVVVNEEQLKGFLRNSLQNVDNLAQNLYEWQIDNQ